MSSEMDRDEVLRHNRAAWDRMARHEHILTRPAANDELANPLATVDGIGWLPGGIRGWKVLCLAAGGGRHGPLYASAGADVTVVDLSPAMLALDHEMAQVKQLMIRTVESSMDNLSMFADSQFDLVIHPVSTCYLASIAGVFKEISRVLRAGGIYISQHKQPTNLQASLETQAGKYVIEHPLCHPGPVQSPTRPSQLREPGTKEFIHSLSAILGGICRSGMVIEDIVEPQHADPAAEPDSFGHRCHFIAPYVRVKARRLGKPTILR